MKASVMRLFHPISLVAITLPLAGLFGACSGARGSGSTSEGVGGAGSSTTDTGSSTGDAGGGIDVDLDAATTDASTPCPGDAGAWMELTAKPGACTTAADCCVIVSPCLSEAQVVAAAQMDEASSVWPYCPVACTDCVAPAIEVGCVDSACVGRRLIGAAPDSPLRESHCGSVIEFAVKTGPTGVHFTCGG